MCEAGVLLARAQQPTVVGLNEPINTLQNVESLQRQEYDEVLGSKHATRRACVSATTFEITSDSLEPFPESGAFQSFVQNAEQPESYRNTQSAESDSSRVTSGIHTPIHSPKSDVGAYQALDESTEKLELQPSHPIIGSSSAENGEQCGLAASIHAPERCLPSQAVKHSSNHSADTPNWAAAARAKASAKPGSSSPTCRGQAPAELALDEDESELSTTTRCAVQDEEEEGSVDNSDGSLGSTDDQEGVVGPGEAEDGPDADADPNEEDSTTRSRRTRRRGRPRRPRQKVPYLPPPRMRNLTQHPIVDVFAAQAQALNVPAAPSTSSSGQYYTPVLPQTSQHGTSIPSGVIPPSVTTHGQLGQHLHYQAQHLHLPHPAGVSPPPVPVPNLSPFPSPDTYHPPWYSRSPFPQYVSPQMPFASQYGR
jgi:hypothetical protein